MTRKFKVKVILSGLLAGMVLGAPLWGAISSAFWSTGADTNEARRVASLLYAQTGLDPAQSSLKDHMRASRCGNDVHRLLRSGDVTLVSALGQHHAGLVRSHYDNLASDALASLPAPVLGALQGCVNGSPAGHLCLSHASKIATTATAVPEATEKAWLAAADREIEAAWCAADPGLGSH